MAKAETKSELNQIISNLRDQQEFNRHEGNNLRRLIVDLVKDERTLKMRFQWLETAAEEVCTSCKEHQPGAIERLADELGIEIKQEK